MRIVPKRWGKEIWLVNNEMYCGKLLYIGEGKFCSLHCHYRKHETFYVLNGGFDMLLVDCIEKNYVQSKLYEAHTLEIPQGSYHQMYGLKKENMILEISTHHDDADSCRFNQIDPEGLSEGDEVFYNKIVNEIMYK